MAMQLRAHGLHPASCFHLWAWAALGLQPPAASLSLHPCLPLHSYLPLHNSIPVPPASLPCTPTFPVPSLSLYPSLPPACLLAPRRLPLHFPPHGDPPFPIPPLTITPASSHLASLPCFPTVSVPYIPESVPLPPLAPLSSPTLASPLPCQAFWPLGPQNGQIESSLACSKEPSPHHRPQRGWC